MPFLAFNVDEATLSSDVVTTAEINGKSLIKLRKNQSLDYWRWEDKYKSSGIVTYKNLKGWALKIPPRTFEPTVIFAKTDIRNLTKFALHSAWSIVSGATILRDAPVHELYGTEFMVTRDPAIATAIVSRPVTWNLLATDTLEFRLLLPSNATSLSIRLDSPGATATYTEFSPIANNWNLFLIEVDQPTSTTGVFNSANVTSIRITVGFTGAVATTFYVTDCTLDRTSNVGGEIRWQVSLDEGTTWLGWNGAAWAAGVWTHQHWIERRLALLNPATYYDEMSFRVRARLTPSNNLRQTPYVGEVICGVDLDSAFHVEDDVKRSLRRAVAAAQVYLRAKAEADGTATIDLRSHFSGPVVSGVYEGTFLEEDTTTNLFLSQAGSTVTLTGSVTAGTDLIIHYRVSPPVKIAADRFLIESAVPEIDLAFPTLGNQVRHGVEQESFVNRALGKVYTGGGLNFLQLDLTIFCFANDNTTVAAMVDAMYQAVKNGFTSDGLGITWTLNDMLPGEINSEHNQGLHGRRVNSGVTCIQWRDLQLTEEPQVRGVVPRIRPLSKVGYRSGNV